MSRAWASESTKVKCFPVGWQGVGKKSMRRVRALRKTRGRISDQPEVLQDMQDELGFRSSQWGRTRKERLWARGLDWQRRDCVWKQFNALDRIGHTLLPALLNGRGKIGGILTECREQFWWQYLPEWNWCVTRLQ